MTIGIIGLGYVGLPLAVAFAEAGSDVVGLDVDRRVVDSVARGESSVEDVLSERLAPLVGERIEVTTDHGRLADCDAMIICVPTWKILSGLERTTWRSSSASRSCRVMGFSR